MFGIVKLICELLLQERCAEAAMKEVWLRAKRCSALFLDACSMFVWGTSSLASDILN